VLDTKFSHYKGSLKMGVAAGHDATNATEVVELMSSTSHVDGATFVNLVPDRAKQPTLKTASGFIAGRCTYLSTVFKYDSAAGTDKKHASSLTMFENAGIGVGKTITYELLLGSLDKDGGLRTLLADGFRSTQAVPVAEDTHAYTAVTTAYPSMVSSFASPLPSEAELTRLAHVLKEEFKHRPVARTKAMQPATGRGSDARDVRALPLHQAQLPQEIYQGESLREAREQVQRGTRGCCAGHIRSGGNRCRFGRGEPDASHDADRSHRAAAFFQHVACDGIRAQPGPRSRAALLRGGDRAARAVVS
jgi:hypothetical protein